MSQLEVDKIIPQSGTTLTIGDSGDTISFADGATLAIDTNTLAIDSTNNRVGIGTTNPTQELHIVSTQPSILLEDSDNNGQALIDVSGGNINISADHTGVVGSSNIDFLVDNNQYMRIASSGDISFYEDTGTTPKFFWDASAEALGIGTSTPNQPLEIFTNGSSSANPVINLRMNQGNSANGDNQAITFDFKPYSYSYYNRAASIGYVTENDWTSLSSSGWDGRLTFNVSTITNIGSADTLPTERMCINEEGNVGIGTSSPTSPLHVAKSGTGVWFQTERTDAGGFFTISHNSQKTYFNTEQDYIWSMNGTEAMRIDTSRTVLINTTSNPLSSGLTVSVPGSTGGSGEQGWGVTNAGAVYHQTDLGNQMLLNDSSASAGTHNYVLFRYGGATIGDIDTTDNSTIRYNTFTGGHWSQFHDGTNPELKRGTVMSLTGDKLEYSKCEKTVTREDGTEELQKFEIAGTHEIGSEITVPNDEYGEEDSTTTATVVSNSIADHLVKVKVSDSIADKAVYGVWAGKYNDGDLSVEALGTSKIRIKQGEVLEVGDLLESAGDGTAQKQSDDIIKNSTIAKVTSPIAIETFDDNSFLVSCVLYCG